MKSKKQQGLAVILVVVLLMQMFPLLTFAESSIQTYYYDNFIKTKKDKGYSGEELIKESDKHYGWKLGKFVVEGYTNSPCKDENGNQVFLKNVGDTVTLSFCLEQDINKLNGNEKLSIGEDKDGYDQHFLIDRQNFGRGALLVKFTDYQNSAKQFVYTNYLPGKTVGANTQIKLCEEGDYEVALNYKVKETHISVAGYNILPTETDYRIFFKFSVRNGNCMVYPFDIVTGDELTNSTMTENGFKLDLAKSRYLDINIKKEILVDSADGVIEDTRFNKSANDGNEYTDEGIYTITVKNRYLNGETVKKIYVGKNSSLKKYFIAELSLENSNPSNTMGKSEFNNGNVTISKTILLYIAIIAIVVIFIVILVVLVLLKKRKTSKKTHNNEQN